MRTPVYIAAVALLASCATTSRLTEQVIKTEVEKHQVGFPSTIRTFALYTGTANDGTSAVEITGFKYDGKKGMVIAAEDRFSRRMRSTGEILPSHKVHYVILDQTHCETFIMWETELAAKIKADQRGLQFGEAVYHDYMIAPELFISYRYGNGATFSMWLDGVKFTVDASALINRMLRFTAW